jgi:hypothetical protein
MKYVKLFKTTSFYNTYKQSADFVTPNVSLCEDAPTTIHYEPYHDYSQDYLTFEALETGTFTFTSALSYSLDGGKTWTALATNTATPSVTVGNEICFKANLTSNMGIGTFSATGNFNAKGNPMSLFFGDNFVGQTSLSGNDYAFAMLFNKNTKLISVEHLSLHVTTLAKGCYNSMFCNCTSLTIAPELPATTLAQSCYSYMFSGCTSLTTAPELPATTLVAQCYVGMFYNCSSLNYIKAAFTTIPSKSYTDSWVNGVAASGTFIKNNSATWDVTGTIGIPSGWTVDTYTP